MPNPYLVLQVPPDADDATIRQAYLAGIRDFPPEQHPERFQAIARAYEQIRDNGRRLAYFLFDQELPGETPGATLANYLAAAPVPKPLSFEAMKTFLRAC